MNYKIEKIGKLRKYKPIYDNAEQIAVGTSVKLIFKLLDQGKSSVGAERLWVKVKSIEGSNIKGTIDNDPIYVDMKDGDEISFTKSNIFDIDN